MMFMLRVAITIVFVQLTAGCAPSAEWIKAERNKVKFSVEPLAEPGNSAVRTQPPPTGYRVKMEVTANPMSAGGDTPLFYSGGSNLGAAYEIERPNLDYRQAYGGVDQCIGKAAEERVLQYSLPQSPGSGTGIQSSYQSIEPFVGRWRRCMETLGYKVRESG